MINQPGIWHEQCRHERPARAAAFGALDVADKTVTVAITDDNVVEAAETFTAALSTATPLLGRGVDTTDSGTGTITDNDIQSDLAVTKAATPSTILAGARLTFTITVGNLGPSDAETVVLTDPLPTNTTFVSNSGAAGWSCVVWGNADGDLRTGWDACCAAVAHAGNGVIGE